MTLTTTIESEAAAREEGNAELVAGLNKNDHNGTESISEVNVINNAERGRWIAALGAEELGELTYRFVGGRVVLLSTWVTPAYRDHGVATELVARALDEIRESGKTITVICPFVGEFIARNPEYLDLIDKVRPGAGAHPHHVSTTGRGDEEQISTFEHDLTSPSDTQS
jgi:predicted GNAT family acetyltransferase